ncbi:MAG: N-6 DNA methylase [Verrucomicrobiota bacterium JB022]|nr:N-6 DNA methylase [Verrucomicrobiota bacterium JB022]
MLPLLVQIESACWGRWEHWLQILERGQVGSDPIPRIEFNAHDAEPARRMHEKALDCICAGTSWQGWDSWRIFDYYLDWLLYGFGDPTQRELPEEPQEGAFSRLYQVFCLEAMIAWPADLFGDLLAENRHGRGSGFFPTPHDVVELMTTATFAEGVDHRLKSVMDPCVGTGRMILHASNHSYLLYAQDVNLTVLKACRVNGYCFAPWFVRPLKELRSASRERQIQTQAAEQLSLSFSA